MVYPTTMTTKGASISTWLPIRALVRWQAGSPQAFPVLLASLAILRVLLQGLQHVSHSEKDRARLEVLEETHIVCATLSFSGSALFGRMQHKFDVVVIDESAQAVEPATLIPLVTGCKQVRFHEGLFASCGRSSVSSEKKDMVRWGKKTLNALVAAKTQADMGAESSHCKRTDLSHRDPCCKKLSDMVRTSII